MAHIADLAEGKRLDGVVLMSGKPCGFIAGADRAAFDTLSDPVLLRRAFAETLVLFARIETLPIAVVMAIDGYCLGGGLELALSGHDRIAIHCEATPNGFLRNQARNRPGPWQNGARHSAGGSGR